jgi:hypothetical protein
MKISRWSLLIIRNISGKVVEKTKTHFVFDVFRKSFRLWDNVEKYGGVIEATDDNMAHALCMLGNATRARAHVQAQAHTQTKIYNTYCFSKITVLSWTMFCFTLYVHWLSCLTWLTECFWLITIQINIEDHQLISLRNCEFNENRCSWWQHVLLKRVN